VNGALRAYGRLLTLIQIRYRARPLPLTPTVRVSWPARMQISMHRYFDEKELEKD
jgi:hypothetical protein